MDERGNSGERRQGELSNHDLISRSVWVCYVLVLEIYIYETE